MLLLNQDIYYVRMRFAFINEIISCLCDFFVDHVIVTRKGGYPVAIDATKERYPLVLEDLQIPPDSQM